VIHTVLDFTDPQMTDRSLFEAFGEAARAAPRRRLFVYTTGCSIYGKRPERVLDEETPANPAHPLAFRMEMEKAFFAASVGDTRKIVLRPGFMYGADGHSSISGRWFEMGEEGRPVYRGDRGKGWSWIHIDDLAAAYVRVAESHPALDREIFCLADGQRPACVEVMRACVRSAGFTGELVFAPPSEEDISSTLFDQDEFIDSRKAARLLGWHPRHPGILDEVELYYASWKAARAERSARRPVEPRLDL
jgi:nucleoside-diphosphate-sugar epimerase